MKVRIVSAAVAAMLATTAPLQADVSKFCKPGEGVDGKIKLDYNIRPSLVIDDATLDVAMSEISSGDGNESAFSFARTIGAILKSAGLPDDAVAREAFLRTMITSLDNDKGLLLNPYSAIAVPLEDRLVANSVTRRGEGTMEPARLLDPNDAEFGVKPLALFNRLDLAPSDWRHCGEYRIVYAIPNGGFQKRFLLIFEAMLANPYFIPNNPNDPKNENDTKASEAGCRAVAEFWAGLRDVEGADDNAKRIARAKLLSQFYYDGAVDGQPALEPFEPVVSYKHYGGDGGRGQVRANMFFQLGWQLREWLTPLVIGPTGATVAFVPDTVKDNPISELYLDDIKETALGQANLESTVALLHSSFIENFGTEVQDHLFVERSEKFRDLIGSMNDYDLGELKEDDILVSTIALGSSKRFDDFQSSSNPDANVDEPSKVAGDRFRQTLELLLTRPTALNPQTVQILLNRAEAGTCSGCHQTSPREGIDFDPALIKVKPDGAEVFWPDVVPGGAGFVHVDESRRLSVALEKHFLPVRHYMMGRHLCKVLPGAVLPPPPLTTLAEGTIAPASGAAYVDAIIAEGLKQAEIKIDFPASQNPVAALAALSEADQAAVVDQIARRRDTARAIEQATPGAFVEVRRPH